MLLSLSTQADWYYSHVEYNYAYDADTLNFSVQIYPKVFVAESMRLVGVDTPEIKGQCEGEKELAIAARNYVRQLMLEADEINLIIEGRGKFGRPLIKVNVNGTDLATELIDLGFARPYDGGPRSPWC